MLVCSDCKTPIVLKTNYSVLSNYYLNFSGITLTDLEIVKPKIVVIDYYCPSCESNKKLTDLETKCYLCSRYVPIEETVVVKSRGNYHKSCAEEFFGGESTVSLVKLLEKGVSLNE